MYILGDLITIPPTEKKLPLPWWHRAPLAFESGTQVTLAVTEPNDKPGDLLVSVIDPNKWHQSYRIRCFYPDKPGIVAKAFGFIAKHRWNIALAETITVEGGRRHALDLICEPAGYPVDPPSVDHLIKELADAGFEEPRSRCLGGPGPSLWNRAGEVRAGWLVDNNGEGLLWREKLTEQLQSLNRLDEFDLTKLVISADTARRCLRVVVPRKGVQNVVIEHKDVYGALKELTDALFRARFNVLSSLLKRGGVSKENAVLIAICEPTDLGETDEVLRGRILNEIGAINQFYRAHPKITQGHSCYKVLNARNRGDRVIRPPDELALRVKKVLEGFGKTPKMTIFLSYRFGNFRTEPYVTYLEEVRRILASCGCEVVESPSPSRGSHEPHSSFEDVSAKMWASDAIIVLMAATENTEESFSFNLAHEFGFFQGQDKPILWLMEQHDRIEAVLDRMFSNVKGMSKPHFAPDKAIVPNHPDSIASKITEWLRDLDYGKP